MIEPLNSEGVESIEIREEEEILIDVGDDEVSSFEVADRPLAENEATAKNVLLTIETVAFRGAHNKWRLNDGQRSFTATIEDPDFLARVGDRSEAFANGDMLKADLRMVQWQDEAGKLRTDYYVSDIAEHLAGQQMRIERD